jgi:hypothetical protein
MMKRAIIFIFLLIAFTSAGYSQSTPEFRLDLHYKDAGGGGSSNPVAFGYDPKASDTLDSQFGEIWYPTAKTNPGGYYLAFQFPGDTIASLVDIMHKPTTDSFVLQYKVFLSAFIYPAVLSWDRSKIPANVTGIWIAPAAAPFLIMADMSKQDSVTIDLVNPTDTNYANNWEAAIITLFYNTPPHTLAVSQTASPGAGLVSELTAYPNPMSTSGALSFVLSEPAALSIVGYDALGREVLRIAKNEPAGESQIDLSAASSAMLASARGAILLRVDASSGTRNDTKTVMLVKE